MKQYKRYSDRTLMRMTKADLIEQLRVAEYNRDVAEEFLSQQAENVKDWKPVRHGTWDGKTLPTFLGVDQTGAPITGRYPVYVCSCCGKYSAALANYCSFCGAKMDGGENHGD